MYASVLDSFKEEWRGERSLCDEIVNDQCPAVLSTFQSISAAATITVVVQVPCSGHQNAQ